MQVWQDEYDGIWTCLEGLPGGHNWMMVTLNSRQDQVQAILDGIPQGFKGNMHVLLLPEPTATPFERALELHRPRGVMVLSRNLQGGPGLELPEKHHESTSGLVYLEGGSYPAWTSALVSDGDTMPDLWASVCAKLDTPVVVCTPDRALQVWQHWWESTPLALQNLEC
ncbi:hypothetical protein [Deinococcus cellulosilyticus]|uniref:Uncharacterized protein n=1 Tax=Deinococcus cellulosilyticus (strain DSM 18568 / NBRC 106333 / KACC 11606 / 5516J-15) TaxID=1223518 RepID=A0A511NAR8_DEIC1|nr:hypothetical protein [Deinococcus cellulosilyticus]GEM49929.1 hypothetical protein DC3_55640 [Deinococcus cellulosilyticus NBRC 106333 = KACC 11606]